MSFARSYERCEQLTLVAAQQFHPNRIAPARGVLAALPPALPALPALGSSTLPLPPPQRPASTTPGTVTVAGCTMRRLTPTEVDERRRNGQCFNCDEKYVHGHNRVCAKLFHLEMHEEDKDATMDAPVDQPRISLLAIAGIHTRDTTQVAIRFGAVTVTTLLDSGLTHNFVSVPAVAHCDLCFIPRDNITVIVANGDRVPTTGVFRSAMFSIDSEQFTTDFYILPLRGYNMVLDTDWLATMGPIL
jgi:hypothetical protein